MAKKKRPSAASVAVSEAAALMVSKRWKKTTKKERSDYASMLGEARAKKLTPARRIEIARMGGLAAQEKRRAEKES